LLVDRRQLAAAAVAGASDWDLATILVALIFRGSVIVWDWLVAAKEVRWPLQVRGPLPSPDMLPSIPPARSWDI
jgi:hypothetical protein